MSLRYLDSNNHAVFALHYHLILVVKYRRRAISDEIQARIKEIAEYIGKKQNVSIMEMNGEADHIHFLLKTKPNCDLSKFINSLKTVTSRRIREDFPQVKTILWNGAFWSNSYCLITVGGAPLEVLKKYIEQQGVHEKEKTSVPKKNYGSKK